MRPVREATSIGVPLATGSRESTSDLVGSDAASIAGGRAGDPPLAEGGRCCARQRRCGQERDQGDNPPLLSKAHTAYSSSSQANTPWGSVGFRPPHGW
jgi:hypothetical protein